MFSIEQVKQAHNKEKSGADFPAYIQEIKSLGVSYYRTYVTDGHTDFYGANDYYTSELATHDVLSIAETTDRVKFQANLRAHQQGKTSYLTFFEDCAASGIDKWEVQMEKMTCTYFDKVGNKILVEQIPV